MDNFTALSRHRRECRTVGRQLPLHLRITFVLLFGFGVVLSAVMVRVRTSTPPANPFVDSSWRQAVDELEAQGFVCSVVGKDSYEWNTSEACVLFPSDGAFRSIFIFIEEVVEGYPARQTVFTLRANTFRVGDLMALWGVPEIREFSRTASLLWRKDNAFAWVVEFDGQISPWLPVSKVYITHSDSPVGGD